MNMDLFGEDIVEEEVDEKAPASAVSTEQPLFEHPRSMPFCLGQDKAEKRLLDLIHSQRMPHGLIFSGIKGIGKATMAYRLARGLLKGEEGGNFDLTPDDPIFRRVVSGGHPDLLTIERLYDATKNKTQDSLSVEQLRKVEPFLRKTSSNGGWRVVIIDDADTMNRNAQNALLKILEEPPPKTVIILVAHRAGALIPTIRSRAQIIGFQALPPETITDLLSQQGQYIDPYQGETLSALAGGSFGRALSVLEDGGLETLTTIIEMLKTPEIPKIHAMADQMARAGQDIAYKNFTATLLWLFKTLTFAKARGQGLSPDSLNTPTLTQILQNSSLAHLLEICDKLSEHFQQTERSNLDKRQAVLGAFGIINA